MTLREFIVLHGLRGTPEQIAEALNSKCVPIYNSELYTSTGLIMELGPDLARQALAGLEAAMAADPLLRSQYDKLNSTGLDFSHPLTQEFIDNLQRAGFISEEIANELKAIGIRYISLYEQFAGEGAVITPEEVEAALQPQPVTGKRIEMKIAYDPFGNSFEVVEYELSGHAIYSRSSWIVVNNSQAPDEKKQQFVQAISALLNDYIRVE